jgi:hypothetical protein
MAAPGKPWGALRGQGACSRVEHALQLSPFIKKIPVWKVFRPEFSSRKDTPA